MTGQSWSRRWNATDLTIGSADLIEAGLVDADVARFTARGILVCCDGGGSGNPYRFPAEELVVARAILAWRQARDAGSVVERVAAATRAQLPPDGEATTCHVVTVSLGPGVSLVVEVER